MKKQETLPDWVRTNLPDLRARRALVTGGAGGLGFQAARGLALAGAEVWIADRDVERGMAAAAQLRGEISGARVAFKALDLADLAQVRAFAAQAGGIPLDILVNNAGLLPPLERALTRDGFELGFGVSVLGHYALTGALLEALARSAAPRVVWVSSLVQAHGALDFEDLHGERGYEPQRAYNQAKLASLMLALELDRRARAAGAHLASLSAHPGIARTAIGASRKQQRHRRLRDWAEDAALAIAMRCFGQDADRGALPLLHAAAAADARSGRFYGPGGFGQFAGPPREVTPSARAADAASAARLWSVCESLTGVRYAWPAARI